MSLLVEYFYLRDSEDPMAALELLDEKVDFHLLPFPGQEFKGRGRETLRTLLSEAAGVGLPTPSHKVTAVASSDDGRDQFVLGFRVIDGVQTGVFIAAAREAEGALVSYYGAFLPS